MTNKAQIKEYLNATLFGLVIFMIFGGIFYAGYLLAGLF